MIVGRAVLLACFDDLVRELGEGLGFWLGSWPDVLPDFVEASTGLAVRWSRAVFESDAGLGELPPCAAAATRPAASARASVAVPCDVVADIMTPATAAAGATSAARLTSLLSCPGAACRPRLGAACRPVLLIFALPCVLPSLKSSLTPEPRPDYSANPPPLAGPDYA